VLTFLRFIGVMNAAVWLGASVFYVMAAGPAFASEEMLRFLPLSHATAARQVVLERLFSLQCWCGAVAIGHLVVESLYGGKPHARWSLYLVLVLFALSLAGAFGLHPRLTRLHQQAYTAPPSSEQAQKALRSFRNWHVFSQFFQLGLVAGLFLYTWQITTSGIPSRFASTAKFRG
jgi:hypothetical protein